VELSKKQAGQIVAFDSVEANRIGHAQPVPQAFINGQRIGDAKQWRNVRKAALSLLRDT